jgi:hypothetical protein
MPNKYAKVGIAVFILGVAILAFEGIAQHIRRGRAWTGCRRNGTPPMVASVSHDACRL